jgi:fructose-1,6-bisphosphatase I
MLERTTNYDVLGNPIMAAVKLKTIQQFIFENQLKHYPKATGAFTSLLGHIILAAKSVSWEINRAGLANIIGATDDKNVHGEHVQKLDHFANETFLKCIDQGGHASGLISEELDEIHPIKQLRPDGNYLLTLDPLDGSSNIDVNVSVGSIFGIYRKNHNAKLTERDFLQPGSQLAAAGYVIYGSSTMFVLSTGYGVHGFTLDPSVGEFLLSHPDIKMPAQGKYYSVNESNAYKWSDSVRKYVSSLKDSRHKYSARYIGSLVADFHRNLLKGGVFAYPATSEGKAKLRLMYEAIPMAFLAEQAGGEATDGKQNILDIVPKGIHETVPLFIGSKTEMVACKKRLNS